MVTLAVKPIMRDHDAELKILRAQHANETEAVRLQHVAELESLRTKYEALRGRYQTVVHERDRLTDGLIASHETATLICDGRACNTKLTLVSPAPVEPPLLRLAGAHGWRRGLSGDRHFCPACAKIMHESMLQKVGA